MLNHRQLITQEQYYIIKFIYYKFYIIKFLGKFLLKRFKQHINIYSNMMISINKIMIFISIMNRIKSIFLKINKIFEIKLI